MLNFNLSATTSVLLSLVVTLMVLTNTKAAPTYLAHSCPNTTAFSPNTTYETNLDQLLSWLSTNASRDNGFYTTTTGANIPGNTVYGLFLCRGDVTTDICRDCVSTATKEVLQRCPVEKDSVIWYDECMLRYSNKSFFSTVDEMPMISLLNTANSSEQSRFMQLLGDTVNAVAKQAADAGTSKKYATKEANFSGFQNLYTLAQCTPDLSEADCNTCLAAAIGNLPNCCNGKQGGRVLTPSCNIRYELYQFYRGTESNLEEQRPKGKGGISAVTIIAIVIPIIVAILLFFLGCWFLTRTPRQKHSSVSEENVDISGVEFLQFDLNTIQVATNNFSYENKLGEGGFGEVFKGSLPNGQDIAVKRLSSSSRQGAEEFKNETVLVAKLQHRNLVRLLGFCSDEEEKMLIYEYVPNRSLDNFLFDSAKKQQLNWSTRYKIIKGIGKGMLYLHEESQLRIIHRDLKVGNILLDKNMTPKISDFGMARIFGDDQTHGKTSKIVGTYGYMSPEYAMHGYFSMKSDVYSFGVLVLEIISGKKNRFHHESSDAEDLLSYAWKCWKDGNALELLDTTLRDSYSKEEVTRCIHIGLLCVQEDPAQRPTMRTIALMLNSYSITVALPERPASFLHSRTTLGFPTKEAESDKSRESVMIEH